MGSRLERIGPYRVESRLGAGGMGEVYRAWDERLERWVALKLIRPESAGSDQARERFRREARAAASLSHPSLVQIHDILVAEEGDAIVMELVEGEPLARRLARGPLSVREAVRLGRDIAEGLASAHAKGLIHRDLKSENVMVTADGRAKILDFGLAKRLEGEAGLTQDSVVVGTFRSMSPEQARGLPLDARSDLFSLGTLLYEMLAGRSPFEGDSTFDILTRVCTARQAPLWDFVSGLPPDLSDLVDRLLEKDPALRPQTAREVAAILENLATSSSAARLSDEQATWIDGPGSGPPVRPVTAAPSAAPSLSSAVPRRKRWAVLVAALAVAAVGLAVFLFRRPAGEPVTVAVLKPEVEAEGEGERAELVAAGLRMALLRALLSLEGVSALAPEQVDPVSGSPVQVAKAMAADEVVTGRLSCDLGTCQVSLSRVRGADGRLLWTKSLEVPVEEPYLLAEAAESYLKQAYEDHRVRKDASRLDVSPRDYEEYLRLRRAYESWQDPKIPVDALLTRLESIRRSSPRFLEAAIFEADALRYRFHARRDPADLEQAFEVLDRARELAPDDPRTLFSRFEVALKAERLAEAEEALDELERLQPGDPGVAILRARMLERQGETERALALTRQAVQRRPSWGLLFRLADMEYRLGESDAARLHLRQLLDRFPGYYAGESLLAQIELQYGSPQRAAEIYEGLVRRSPQAAELTNLGTAYLLLKRFPAAEEKFRQVLELEPNSPFATLNLADVLLLSGQEEASRGLYLRVLELIARDPAAGNWQLLSVKAQALAHLGRRGEAVETVQRVLVLAQNNSQAMSEVSLVYVLVGDLSSAQVNAEKALALGVEPRWFSFPWFDPLRASPEWKDLLARRAS
ncbi:MAG TPA: protein kinase [Thermoanaerobaculia bacterium]|nr:protein kinase [Thermoanaerobaculia bacterium]